MKENGGAGGDRTLVFPVQSRVLYPLSYRPITAVALSEGVTASLFLG